MEETGCSRRRFHKQRRIVPEVRAMTRKSEFIAAVVGIGLVAFLVFRTTLPRHDFDDRREIESQPGAVAYSEGTTTAPELFHEALVLTEKGKISDAEAVYRKVIDREPDNAPGYIGVASCRLAQGDLKEAEKQYRRALSIDAGSSMAMLGLGSVAFQRGDHSTAIDFYRQALAAHPDLPDAHLGLGFSYEEMSDRIHAVEHYRKFLKLAPESNQATTVRAHLSDLQNKLKPPRDPSKSPKK